MSFPLSYFFDLSRFSHQTLFQGTTYPWEALLLLEKYLSSQVLGRQQGTISPSAYLTHPELITIGQGSIVEPGAYISGPCIIGNHCVIRHGAYIRGNVLTGDGCIIGHDSEVKNAIFLDNVHAAHFAYVGDSILGNSVNLGAGTKCANLKLDRKTIKCFFESKKIDTGMTKLGAIIGDRTQLGCNVVTNPGSLLGQDVFSHPCLNLEGFIPSNSLVRAPAKPIIQKKTS